MITINFESSEQFDEEKNEFSYLPELTASFEYSLKAIYEWEAEWKTPFISTNIDNYDLKIISFCEYMIIGDKIPREYFNRLKVKELQDYISSNQTATTFNNQDRTTEGRGKVYTAEEIYALMFMNGIPLEFENRNLNRLLIMLKIISTYTNPPKKMSRTEVLSQNARLNAERKKQYQTRG